MSSVFVTTSSVVVSTLMNSWPLSVYRPTRRVTDVVVGAAPDGPPSSSTNSYCQVVPSAVGKSGSACAMDTASERVPMRASILMSRDCSPAVLASPIRRARLPAGFRLIARFINIYILRLHLLHEDDSHPVNL